MRHKYFSGIALLTLACLISAHEAWAVGVRGGGGGHGGGGHMGGARPSMSRPSGRMPSSMSRPSFNRPSSGGRPTMNRPPQHQTVNRPSFNRPTTGNRPDLSRPSFDRPHFGSAPQIGGNRRPDFGGSRPGSGGISRPGGRPDFAGSRPGTRPLPGDVGDFLGIGRPIDNSFARPTRPGGNRPGGGENTWRPDRPGNGGRPNRPDISRPDRPGRPDGDRPNRPGDIGDHRPGRPDWPNHPGRPNRPNRPIDPGFNHRPDWANMRPGQSDKFHNHWHNAIDKRPGMNNWLDRHPDRWNHYHNWAHHVNNHWHHDHHHWFRPGWWNNHPHWHGGWNYWGYRPWRYWWTVPAWGSVTSWFGGWGWSQPVYYDYGSGGNVVYEGDTVYVNGQDVGTPADMAMSAADLATVPAPTEDQVAADDWMALGTFAVSTNEADTSPTRILQLAVNKDGIVSGTLFNTATDKTQAVQGKVDKETQRVAFRIGDNEQVVAETGIYNLTQNEAPMLVHYGADRTENFLLVRLNPPDEEDTSDEVSEGRSF